MPLASRMTNLDSFKAYDVPGRIPDEINESLAYDIGRAYAAFVKPRRVAVGYDIRLSSPKLAAALKRGLMDVGVDVLDIGLWGTEGANFATSAERSEEHTSELQSQSNLVCRLLLE